MSEGLSTLARLAPRLVKLIGGEAMQSAFHLALNLSLLHAVSPYQYGIFTLLMVLGGLGLTYARSMTAIPASTAIAPRSGWAADAHEMGFGSAAVVLSAVFGVGVALALSAWLEEGALDGALFVGLWMFRSHLRTVFFARGRERIVGISDLCFTLTGVLGAAAAILPGGPHVLDRIFMVLILCNGIGVAVMLALARRRPRFEKPRRLWRRYRALWPVLRWSFLSVTITNLQGQGMALMVGAFAGPAAYAPIAAALVIFMPLRVVAMGFANMLHPELASLAAKKDAAGVRRVMRTWLAPLVLFGLLYFLAALLMLPIVLPSAFEQTPFYFKGFCAWLIVGSALVYLIPRILLEVTEDYRALAMLSGAAAAAGIAAVAALLMTMPSYWAIAGGALSEIIVVVGSWVIAMRRLAKMGGAT